MHKTHCDQINSGDNVIVGLGDSFTQGVGAYRLDTWASISEKQPNMYNISAQHFLDEQAKNNWVRQLRDTFLPNYKVYNLGMNGGGTRSTTKELALYPLPKNLGNVIVILLSTSLERYDFLKPTDATSGISNHQKWQTIFPSLNPGRGSIYRLEKEYIEQIHSFTNDALEFLFNIYDIQNLCKANGYKFLFGSVFDEHISPINMKNQLGEKVEFFNMIDWDTYIKIPNRKHFLDYIIKLEDPNNNKPIHEYFIENQNAKMPTKYITPCSHFTIEGQYKVAEYLFNVIRKRHLI